jgi:hypothetical protein
MFLIIPAGLLTCGSSYSPNLPIPNVGTVVFLPVFVPTHSGASVTDFHRFPYLCFNSTGMKILTDSFIKKDLFQVNNKTVDKYRDFLPWSRRSEMSIIRKLVCPVSGTSVICKQSLFIHHVSIKKIKSFDCLTERNKKSKLILDVQVDNYPFLAYYADKKKGS